MSPAAAGKTRIINRGRGHSYELDGQKVIGVTTAISNGVPKPALVGWAAGSVGDFVADRLVLRDGHVLADDVIDDLVAIGAQRDRMIPRWQDTGKLPRTKLADGFKGLPYADRDAAGNRGTEVHTLAQRLAEGEEVTPPPELVGHVDSYLRFRDEWLPTDELLELVVINRTRRYMGRLDLICELDNAPELGRCLIDLKTNRSGPFGEVSLQLAAYRYAETYLDDTGAEQPMPEIDTCAALWVRTDGYDLYPYACGPDQFAAFLYAKQVAEWCDSSRDLRGNALRPRIGANA